MIRALKATARRIHRASYLLRGRLIRPSLPKNADGRILIHLGCGEVNSPGFINVDARPLPHVHHVCDVTDLAVFPDNHADLVYACHVLEHIEPGKIQPVLCEWKRVLKPGGVLRISVPDFDSLLAVYEACDRDPDSIRTPLMGYRDGYDSHLAIFTYDYLARILREVGFKDIRRWDPAKVDNHDFEDWASRRISWKNSEFHISLNVEAS